MKDLKYNEFCKLRWYLEPYNDFYIRIVLKFTLLQAIFNSVLLIFVESVIQGKVNVSDGKVYLNYTDKAIYILIAVFFLWNLIMFGYKKNQKQFMIFSGSYFWVFSLILLFESCKLVIFIFYDVYLYVIPLIFIFYFVVSAIILIQHKKQVKCRTMKNKNAPSLFAGSFAVLGVVIGKVLSKSIDGQNGIIAIVFALQLIAYFFLILAVRTLYKYFLTKKYWKYIEE